MGDVDSDASIETTAAVLHILHIWINTRFCTDTQDSQFMQGWHRKISERQNRINKLLRHLWRLSLESRDGGSPPEVNIYHDPEKKPTVSFEINVTFGTDANHVRLHTVFERLFHAITTNNNALDNQMILIRRIHN